MSVYKISDLIVSMSPKYEPLLSQSKPYLYNSDNDIQISVEPSEALIAKTHKQNPSLSYGDCEYMLCGKKFYEELINFDGFLLHASAIEYEGKAYLFSAPSGVGKSTHTELWKGYLGDDKVRFINDDKPALILKNDCCFVYGTPFSGKTDLNNNICVPLQAICFLHRATEASISKCNSRKAVKYILDQTLRPKKEENMLRLLAMIDLLLKNYPIFEMGCDISAKAVTVAYNAMKEGRL